METIRKESATIDRSLSERLSKLEENVAVKEAMDETEGNKKPFKWSGRFKRTFKKNPKTLANKVIVLCLNSKRELEEPVVLPIIPGGIIVYRDKAYKFDPSAVYTIKLGNKVNKLLLLREDDRYPVGSKFRQIKQPDINELKQEGRYTGNDPILLKMLWQAQINKVQKNPMKSSWIVWIIVGLIGIGVVYMFMK